ncbi:DUF4189 domain-containing protein [Pseudomonas sp. LS44]|uniref:DUF4189 domain-containing protein n=1 Tax=Pseudomonas sp. LS44 TaxID=1357074 RepID=UPI00215B1747|nr:DUF4189 domain-containing protein [Pseudomonas sp. LS44]UVE18407.1 DUF4189 domain-containing protein [Pseudomonas sp. LS44]
MQRTIKRLHTITLGLALSLAAAQSFAAGALAIDSNQGEQFGFSYNYADYGEAQQRALGECGGNCEVVLQFAGECAAYAADQQQGSSIYGWATAGSSGGAQSGAISQCQSRGGNSCTVRTWGCEG